MGKKSKISIEPAKIKNILAIETSCDDTSVAIVDHTFFVHSLHSENQDSVHGPYGGVIPELACRNHVMRLVPLVDKALKDARMTWE
jgi:N6-L-threonylcarbamoyladenine synthase